MATYYEHVGNPHIHTPYSDGELHHAQVAVAASRAGLNWVIVTDHNVRVNGVEGYYGDVPSSRVVLLTGQEVHDPRRDPPGNHLLVYGVEDEMAALAPEPQTLLDDIRERSGLSFLAHPFDHASAANFVREPALPWHDWDVAGYSGIELWNYMSEFKSLIRSRRDALRYVNNPEKGVRGPSPETLKQWDKLLAEGREVRVVGGADAHGTTYTMGPLRRTVFPYEYLFRCVNTHIISPHNLEGILEHDRRVIEGALRAGHAFVGYDLPASTVGFRFSAQGGLTENAIMGDRIRLEHGVTLQIVVPRIADTRLIFNGEVVAHETESTHMTYIATQKGAYRVEVYLPIAGKSRGWIFSNPIFVT